MKHEELIASLKQLHLTAMAQGYSEVARQCEQSKKTYEQYLAALTAMEIAHKRGCRLARYVKEAKLPKDRRLEDYDFKCRTGISEQQVRRLAEGTFIHQAWNVVFFGGFGVGKSHLALALTKLLCEGGFRCLFISTHELIQSLIDAQMRRMRLMSQRVDHEQLHALNLARNRVRHSAAIAQVGEQSVAVAGEEVAVGLGIPVRHRQRRDRRFA